MTRDLETAALSSPKGGSEKQVPFRWTPELEKTVVRLCHSGFSAAQIAEKIGASSRNQVCGKLWRLGVSRDTDFQTEKLRARARLRAHRARQRIVRKSFIPPSKIRG